MIGMKLQITRSCGKLLKSLSHRVNHFEALKFLTYHLGTSDEEKSRFVHESPAAALDHPKICTVHEIDEAEGQTFIAMAYIDGQSLKEKIEDNLPKVLNLREVLDRIDS